MENGSADKTPSNNNLSLFKTKMVLDVKESVIEGSQFSRVKMDGACFNDVMAKNLKIVNANLSDLEIEGAQLGGAFIHNIGLPPAGHPAHDPVVRQRPLTFKNCDLNHSTLIDCDLTGLSISDCNITGLRINGILITDLLNNVE